MYAIRKCPIRHACYYAYNCNRARTTDQPCELQTTRPQRLYTPTEPIDLRPYTKEQDYIADVKHRFELGFDQFAGGE